MSDKQSRGAREHSVRLFPSAFGAFLFAAILGVERPHLFAANGAHRDDPPTFAADVAPILYKNCTTCHHTGGLGPFSLIDFDSVKAHAGEIREAVATAQMPPWHATGAHGVFSNDRRLSETDKSVILRWIDAGTPAGELRKLPPKPVYATKWEIGKPDLVVSMPQPFTVPASGKIEYQYFEAPVTITEDTWIQSIEILPGSQDVVHHVIVFARVPEAPSTAPIGGSAKTPAPTTGAKPVFLRRREWGVLEEPARVDPNNVPPGQLGAVLGTTAPGTNVMIFPEGTALRLRKGTVLTFQMHYTAHGHETTDRTSVGFRFAKGAPSEEMFISAFLNGAFTIPAGAKNVEVPSEIGVTEPVKIWGLLPHTHVRGTRWQYQLGKPDGSSEIVLDVPNYDFNWQTYYLFAKPLEMPAGSILSSRAWYDNSATNPHNPDATKDVKWGDQTWEEMQYTGFLYTLPNRRLK